MRSPRLVGMIHLPALPGTAAWDGTPQRSIADAARSDAATLQSAGFDAVMVQNSLDRPTRERIDTLGVAQMSSIVTLVHESINIEVGVNVVKNDGPAAMAIAAASGADFVRVKVLTGAVLSAEGVVTGCAGETHRIRTASGAVPSIWADVYEPTSRPLLSDDFDAAVADALDFGLADAVIVTAGTATQTLELARRVRRGRAGAHVVIGGRIDASTVAEALACADTVIIGSALKRVPGIHGRVDFDAARSIIKSAGEPVSAGTSGRKATG
jgi:uncharacterized protein